MIGRTPGKEPVLAEDGHRVDEQKGNIENSADTRHIDQYVSLVIPVTFSNFRNLWSISRTER